VPTTFKISPTAPITAPQSDLITKLAQERDWQAAPQSVITTITQVACRPADVPLAPVLRQAASDAIDFLMKCPQTVAAQQAWSTKPTATKSSQSWTSLQADLADLPVSKYAIPSTADPSVPVFFEIVVRKTSKIRFVNKLFGAPGDWRRVYLTPAQAKHVIAKVQEDPTRWATWYCERFKRCSACDSPLSNAKSLAESMGPVCRKKFQW